MWSASALLGLRCPLLWYWSFTPHAGQCVMPMVCARASTCFLNCLCSRVLVLLTVVLFSLCIFCFVFGGGASQRQRDERLHRLTLLSVLFLFCSLFFFSSLFSPRFSSSSLFVEWRWCVVRAQPSEHARNTPPPCVLVCFRLVIGCVLVACAPSHAMLVAYHHDGIVVHATHCSPLTSTAFLFEHCAPLITSQHTLPK